MKQQKHQLLFPFTALIISTTTTVIYPWQRSGVTLTPDSATSLAVVAKMSIHHLSLASLVDALRHPGYFLFIYVIASANLSVTTLLQMALFALVSFLTCRISLLVFKVPWIALFLGLLSATNPVLIGLLSTNHDGGTSLLFAVGSEPNLVLYIRFVRSAADDR